jgi:hypothetical protein
VPSNDITEGKNGACEVNIGISSEAENYPFGEGWGNLSIIGQLLDENDLPKCPAFTSMCVQIM